jgi:hypothetical protein
MLARLLSTIWRYLMRYTDLKYLNKWVSGADRQCFNNPTSGIRVASNEEHNLLDIVRRTLEHWDPSWSGQGSGRIAMRAHRSRC